MADLIRKEQLTGSQKVVVGEKHNDLVLRTLGKVYIQTGSKLTLLNDLIKTLDQASSSEKNLFVYKTYEDLIADKFIGNGKFAFISSNQNLYIAYGDTYVPIIAKNEAEVNWEALTNAFVSKGGDKMTGTLEVPMVITDKVISRGQVVINETDKPPLIVSTNKLVNQLNAEYINGFSSNELAKIEKDESISGLWNFISRLQISNTAIFGSDLVSKNGFMPGFMGYGWMLDAATNTLTVDNLVVRKTMNVYELVVNKISATNGSLWVTDSAKIEDLFLTYEMEYDENDNIINPNPEEVNGTRLVDPELAVNNTFKRANENLGINEDVNIYDYYFNGNFYKAILDEDNGKYCPFRVNDIVRCQRFYSGRINYYDALVTSGNYSTLNEEEGVSNYIILRIASIETDYITRETALPEIGDGIVRVGNINDGDRQGAVYITSSDQESPYIDICDKMYRPDFNLPLKIYDNNNVLKYVMPTRVRLGRLNGIKDESFGANVIKGMGLYAENVFLKGRFVQVDSDGNENYITIFKGAWNINTKYYHNDQVTYNGELYTSLQSNIGKYPDEENSEYWLKTISKGDDGDGGRLAIQSEKYFKYTDNFNKFVGPNSILVNFDYQGIRKKSQAWYITDSDDNDILISNDTNILIYPTDAEMIKSYSQLSNKIVWKNNIIKIKLILLDVNNISYVDETSIIKISDGANSYNITIMSTKGDVFKEHLRNTRLKALIYYAGNLVEDENFTNFTYLWERYDQNGIKDESFIPEYYVDDTGKTHKNSIIISDKDVNQRTTFNCIIFKNE